MYIFAVFMRFFLQPLLEAFFPLPDHVTLVYISTIQFAFDLKCIISEPLS